MGVAVIAAGWIGLGGVVSCAQEKPAPTTATAVRDVVVEPGVAGGSVEDTYTVSVRITNVDKTTRKVTLATDEGNSVTLTAGEEVRNFDQLRAGDMLNATIRQRLTVYVRSNEPGAAAPTVTHAAALGRAPKGARPGALVAEAYEVVSTVKAINEQDRTATLQFADGTTKVIPVRQDVDMSRYKVGDSVVINVYSAIVVLVAKQ
jgi:hypothetical protein